MRKQMNTCKRRKRSQGLKGSLNPSKRHRDRFNIELDNLAKLLPFPQDVICKLDKLSILRLSASYLRAKNFFQDLTKANEYFSPGKKKGQDDVLHTEQGSLAFSDLLLEALDGFVMILTNNAEVFYISETVQEYLGLSQATVMHQDFMKFIHVDDHRLIWNSLRPEATVLDDEEENKINEQRENSNLLLVKQEEMDNGQMQNEETEKEEKESIKLEKEEEAENDEKNFDRSFVCRIKCIVNTSSGFFRPFRCTGRIRDISNPNSKDPEYGLFLICSPLEVIPSVIELRLRSTLFCTKHKMDFAVMDIDAKGRQLLGYSKKEVVGKSFYCLIHYDDMNHFKQIHNDLISLGKSQGAYRVLSKNFKWQWVTCSCQVVFKDGMEPDFIMTTNRPLSNDEGVDIMKKRDQLGVLGQPFLNFAPEDGFFSPSFSSHSSGSLNGTASSPSNHDSDQGSQFSPRSGFNHTTTPRSSMGSLNSIRSSGSFSSFGSLASPPAPLSGRKKSRSLTDPSLLQQDVSLYRSQDKEPVRMQEDSTTCTSPFSPDEFDELGFDEGSLIMDPQDLESWELENAKDCSTKGLSMKGASNSDLVNSLQMLDFRSANSPMADLPTYEEAVALAQDCLQEFCSVTDIMDALEMDKPCKEDLDQSVPVAMCTTTTATTSVDTTTSVGVPPITTETNTLDCAGGAGTKRKRKVATVMPPSLTNMNPDIVKCSVQRPPCVNLSWNDDGQAPMSEQNGQILPPVSTLITSPSQESLHSPMEGLDPNSSSYIPPNTCISPSHTRNAINNYGDENSLGPGRYSGWRSPPSSCSSSSSLASTPTTEAEFLSPSRASPSSQMVHGGWDRRGSFSCQSAKSHYDENNFLQVDMNFQHHRRSVPATHKYGWGSSSSPSPTHSTISSSRGQLAVPENMIQRRSLPATHMQGWGVTPGPSLPQMYRSSSSSGEVKSQRRRRHCMSLPASHMFGWNNMVNSQEGMSNKTLDTQQIHKKQRKISVPVNQMYGWPGNASVDLLESTSPTYQQTQKPMQGQLGLLSSSQPNIPQMMGSPAAHPPQMDAVHPGQLPTSVQITNHNQNQQMSMRLGYGSKQNDMSQSTIGGQNVVMNQAQIVPTQQHSMQNMASARYGWNGSSPEHPSLNELQYSPTPVQVGVQGGASRAQTMQNRMAARRARFSLPATHRYGWDRPQTTQETVVENEEPQITLPQRPQRRSLPATQRFGVDNPAIVAVSDTNMNPLAGLGNPVDNVDCGFSPVSQPGWGI